MAGAVEGDTFVGRKAQELRGLLKIKYPMEHGVVTDWCAHLSAVQVNFRDDMERVWQHLYTEELKTASEEVR